MTETLFCLACLRPEVFSGSECVDCWHEAREREEDLRILSGLLKEESHDA